MKLGPGGLAATDDSVAKDHRLLAFKIFKYALSECLFESIFIGS